MDVLLLLLVAWVLAAGVMFFLWLAYLARDKPSIVDVGWAGSFTLIALRMHVADGQGPLRHHLLLACTLLWSLRLTWVLLERIMRGQEDLRYKEQSERWGGGLWWRYFLFYQAQALSIVFFVIPHAFAFTTTSAAVTTWDVLACVVFGVGYVTEAWADWTMRRFRERPENHGKLCREGLWYYSRHPNYLGEIVLWFGMAIFALNHPWGWLGFLSPFLMLYTITKVTGIPLTEEHLLKSKGKLYREYQRTTNALVPGIPRES